MRKIITLVIITISVSVILFLSPVFKIKKIITDNTDCIGSETLKDVGIKNQNIFFLSPEKIKKDLKTKYTCLQDVEIEKKYPQTLVIKAITLKPVLKIDNTNLALTENGLVIKVQSSQITPIFFAPSNVKLEEGKRTNDPTVLFTASLCADLQKSDFNVSNIRIVENNLIAVYSRQESVAIFSQNKDPKIQVDSLQAILAKAKIDSSKIEKIDLRFDKPILVLKKQT